MMLNTRQQSVEAIKTIARVLGNLNDQVVYVGGAVIGLYADASFQEAILAHLEPATQTRRYELLKQKLEAITSQN